MESIFEPSPFDIDSTSSFDSNTFLSFSSFADLTSSFDISSPSLSWDGYESSNSKPTSGASDTSSPSPSNPFRIIESAFDPVTPSADIGIFVTPSRAGPSKVGEVPGSTVSYRSSSSTETWDDPVTPSLTTKSSADSFASFATKDFYLPLASHTPTPFSWDEASTSLASSSYNPASPSPHRTTSNPTLGASRTPRAVKPIQSMPALREEDQTVGTPSQWFDGTDFFEGSSSAAPVETADDVLAGDFDWVFGDYGLGDAVPAESTIFSAYQEEPLSHEQYSIATLTPAYEDNYGQLPAPADLSWIPMPTAQDVEAMASFDFTNYTIDPMAVMPSNGSDDDNRPSSAPRLSGGDFDGMLSVPVAGAMMKSLSSDGLVHSRRAPPNDLFSYAPQQHTAAPMQPQALFTHDPSPSYHSMGPSYYPRSMPLTPSATRRSAAKGLSIQINPPSFSTYQPSPLPPTPQSATFPPMQPIPTNQPMPTHPIAMTRAGTQPLPQRKPSFGTNPSSLPSSNTGVPAHLLRAQAIVQMQEAKEQARREEMRREAASRSVGIHEASVMQPSFSQSTRPQPTIMGWGGPSSHPHPHSMPALTTAPLVTVHPPPTHYYGPSPHRVHPPPHPGMPNRPVARMPSSPAKRSKSSQNLSPSRPPKVRSPSGRKRAAPGAFSWGETTFINFTPDDADKLLTGVAPSGSQSKRKREEDAMRMVEFEGEDEDRERSKRSRSDDQ